MSSTGAARFVERLSFFDGQRLFAADLQGLEELQREMRWLHNRSLHQPGVGSGFAVRGAKGAREVSVEPGYALDALGREIVLAASVALPVPPVADDGYGAALLYDLTVAYPDEHELQAAETRAGVCAPLCAPAGAVRLREAPVFCWVRLGPAPDRLPLDAVLRDEVLAARRVRLARAAVLNCRLERPLSLAQRAQARPAARPHVACGTNSVSWTVEGPDKTAGFGLALRARVDTSAAHFRTTPVYQAHVLGERHFVLPRPGPQGGDLNLTIDGFLSLANAGPAGFDVLVLVPEALLTAGRESPPVSPGDLVKPLADQLAGGRWRVQWLGSEA